MMLFLELVERPTISPHSEPLIAFAIEQDGDEPVFEMAIQTGRARSLAAALTRAADEAELLTRNLIGN